VLLEKKPNAMIDFLRARTNVVSQLLTHISHSSITELVLKLISLDDIPEIDGIVDWLKAEGLMMLLIGQLAPTYTPEVHNVAAQAVLDVIAVSYQNSPSAFDAPPVCVLVFIMYSHQSRN
jgi:serine/threonine-protein phosphatase 6 regulatory subunit 3